MGAAPWWGPGGLLMQTGQQGPEDSAEQDRQRWRVLGTPWHSSQWALSPDSWVSLLRTAPASPSGSPALLSALPISGCLNLTPHERQRETQAYTFQMFSGGDDAGASELS